MLLPVAIVAAGWTLEKKRILMPSKMVQDSNRSAKKTPEPKEKNFDRALKFFPRMQMHTHIHTEKQRIKIANGKYIQIEPCLRAIELRIYYCRI